MLSGSHTFDIALLQHHRTMAPCKPIITFHAHWWKVPNKPRVTEVKMQKRTPRNSKVAILWSS